MEHERLVNIGRKIMNKFLQKHHKQLSLVHNDCVMSQEKKAMEKAHESDEIYRTPTPVAPNDATWQQVQELEVRPTTLHLLQFLLQIDRQ